PFQGGVMKQLVHKQLTDLKCYMRVLALVVVSLLTVGAFGQGGGNVAITGTVTDSTGAVLPNAKVTVTQKNTAITRVITTNGTGQFNVSSIPPATYTVTVEAAGFKKYV